MTEQILNNIPADNSAGQVMESSQSGPEINNSVTEKLIPQSEVGKIAGASRKEGHDKGYEKGYQEALAKYQQQQAANTPVVNAPYDPAANSAQIPPSSNQIADLVAKQVNEVIRKERDEQNRLSEEKRINDYVTQIATQLKPKIDAAKDKYEDFDKSVANLHLDKIPHLLEWVNTVPNSGDVLYDLAKNPQKLGILNSMHAPELAIQQIYAISQSLQNNQAAQDKPLPRNPLSVVNPSNVGKSTGEMSGQQLTDDARRKFKF